MKLLILILAVMLILPAGFAGKVFAGESKTIVVSCTIPAIPGVNVPLEEEAFSEVVLYNDDDRLAEQKENGEEAMLYTYVAK